MGTVISKSPSYMVLKGGIYYFRIVVPTDLRIIFRRSEIRKSLKTGYLKHARVKAVRMAVIMQSLFDTLMQGAITDMKELTLSHVQQLADKWLQKALEDDEAMYLRKKPRYREDVEEEEDTLPLRDIVKFCGLSPRILRTIT